MRNTCKHCGKKFTPARAGAQYHSTACRVAAHRKRSRPPLPTYWLGGAPRLTKLATLGRQLLEIAEKGDGGMPKTGRRFYYLALSYGYIAPDMGASAAAAASRAAAADQVTDVLVTLRKQGRLDWDQVLDLTREMVEWRVYDSPRDARAAMRRNYDEDRWAGQPFYPLLIVEKDTLEPVCQPMAAKWQMPFVSSRGYGSLKLQHDVATMMRNRYDKTGQRSIVYFISDLDPSGLDIERAWQDSLASFHASVHAFVRIGLNLDQLATLPPVLRRGIEVKPSDSRSRAYVAQYGSRCWETDILPGAVIEHALDEHIQSWLDGACYARRQREIEQARALL